MTSTCMMLRFGLSSQLRIRKTMFIKRTPACCHHKQMFRTKSYSQPVNPGNTTSYFKRLLEFLASSQTTRIPGVLRTYFSRISSYLSSVTVKSQSIRQTGFYKTFIPHCQSSSKKSRYYVAYLASAAVCMTQQVDDTYFGVSAHEIESTINDLRNLLHLLKADDSCDESLDGWNVLFESPSITIWSRPMKEFYQYKVHGHYDDIPAIAFFYVQMDLIHRKSWDANTDVVEFINKDGDESNICSATELVYWRVHFPRLMAKRDYVYARRWLVDLERNVLVLLNKSVEHPDRPAYKSFVRVNDYSSKLVIQPYESHTQNGFDYVMTYYDDSKLKMPSYAYKQLVKTSLPQFLEIVYKEADRLMAEYRQVLSTGGDFETANSRVKALHKLITQTEKSKQANINTDNLKIAHVKTTSDDTKDKSPYSSQPVLDLNEIEQERIEMDKFARFRRIPVKKINPPQYLPDLKKFAQTLFTEKKIPPIEFKRVHSEANKKRVEQQNQRCSNYPVYDTKQEYPAYSNTQTDNSKPNTKC